MVRVFRHYVPTTLLVLLASDIVVILSLIGLTHLLGIWTGERPIWPKSLALVGVTILTLHVAETYREEAWGRKELAIRIGLALVSSGTIMAAAGFALPTLRFGRLAFANLLGFVALGILASRLVWMRVHQSDRLVLTVLVLGVSRVAEEIVRLEAVGSRPFRIIGFLDDDPGAADRLPDRAELLGKTKDFLNLVDELQPDLVVVALPDMRGALPTQELLECRLRGIGVEDWPTFYEKQTGKVLVTGIRPSWLIFSDGFVKSRVTSAVKRLIDVVLSAAGLLLLLPVLVLVALAIKLESRGPVFFRQGRVGQNGRIFVLNKFRSMRQDAEAAGAMWATPADPRVTRVGRFLRKTRLDEVPQLLNVLAGDMSLIGPRPERPEFVQMLQRQVPYYTGRHAVKPGITGWAQVRFQYAASVEDTQEKLQYDLYYIKNLSLFLDLLILVSTIQVVLFARGAR